MSLTLIDGLMSVNYTSINAKAENRRSELR